MKPHIPHDAVHEEGRASHVAKIFEQQNEQEQDQNLRQKDNHAAYARNDAIFNEALQEASRQRCVNLIAEPIERGGKELHQRLRPRKHSLEHNKHDCEKNKQAADRMEKNPIKPGGQRIGRRRFADGGADDPVGFALCRP